MSNRIRAKQIAVAAALVLCAGASNAKVGYLSTSRDTVVTSGTGLCWRTSAWSGARAIPQCDPVAKVAAPKPAPARVAAAPEPQPQPKPKTKLAPAPAPAMPQPSPVPVAPVIKRVSLSTELLFAFDSAELRPAGEDKLSELAKELEGAQLDRLTAVGYADRIGTEDYNLGLSERRAESVRDYLGELGVETKRIQVAGRGESDPVTAGVCRGERGVALIACLQPDRRVEIEVRGERRASH